MFLMIGVNDGQNALYYEKLVYFTHLGRAVNVTVFVTFTQLLLFFIPDLHPAPPVLHPDFQVEQALLCTAAERRGLRTERRGRPRRGAGKRRGHHGERLLPVEPGGLLRERRLRRQHQGLLLWRLEERHVRRPLLPALRVPDRRRLRLLPEMRETPQISLQYN